MLYIVFINLCSWDIGMYTGESISGYSWCNCSGFSTNFGYVLLRKSLSPSSLGNDKVLFLSRRPVSTGIHINFEFNLGGELGYYPPYVVFINIDNWVHWDLDYSLRWSIITYCNSHSIKLSMDGGFNGQALFHWLFDFVSC